MNASPATTEPKSVVARRSGSTTRQILLASTIGSAIEWYDFYLYSTASVLIIGPLFFPGSSTTATMLATFATYAAGFVARPLGGVVIGHFGDRVGRKNMLALTLLVMGLATFLVGVLPTYEQAGILAPALLVTLRILQGIGIGGEWGGAVLMSAEYAPPGRKGLWTAFPAAGFPLGLLGSTAVIELVLRMPERQLHAWGWRLPFLASIALVVLGVVVRRKVAESPEYVRAKRTTAVSALPVREVLRHTPGKVVRGALAALGLAVIVSTFTVQLFTAASAGQQHTARSVLLLGLAAGALAEALMLPVCGALSDRWGRRPVILSGYAVCALVAVPAPYWLASGEPWLVVMTFVLAMGAGHAAVYGAFASFLVEMFPVQQRYSALAVTYQVGATIASFSPLVATAVAGSEKATFPGILIMIGCLALASAAVAGSRPGAGDGTAAQEPSP